MPALPPFSRLFLLLFLWSFLAACASGAVTPSAVEPPKTVIVPPLAVPAAVVAAEPEPEPGTAVPVTRADPWWGEPLAPVTLVVWGDYECPFTSRHMATLEQLKEAYGPDRLRIVWKHFPLAFHKNARPAHLAAETVFRLGGAEAFWRFHQLAFANQRSLAPASFEAWAAEAGVDQAAFRASFEEQQHAPKIDRDVEAGKAAGVGGTPATFVNGVSVSGARPIDDFRPIIDEQLRAAEELRRSGVPQERVYAALSERNKARAPAPKPPTPPAPEDTTVWKVPVDGSPIRGNPGAPVTLVMFSEFECPFCRRVAPTVDGLEKKYGAQLRVVFKHNPLPFHKRAEPAAELALEAKAQKGDAAFWRAYELLKTGGLEDADLAAHAKSLGLDVARAQNAIAARRHAARIERDQRLADDLQARGTPHFFINGRRLAGAQPAEKFEALIDEQIARAAKLVAAGTPPAKVYDALQKEARAGNAPERILAPAPTKDNPGKGAKPGAKVTIQMFADFQCPFCKRVQPTIDEVIAAYPGKVRVVFRHLPLPFHTRAPLAAEASIEAFRQKGEAGFWAMAQRLWEDQSESGLGREALENHAAAIGLDVAKFRAALDSGAHRAAVEADLKLAERLHITGTPSFAINDYFLGGAQPTAHFKRLVDRALGPHDPPTKESLHGAGKPAAQPGAAQPTPAQPGAAQPGAAQPGAAQPGAAQPPPAQGALIPGMLGAKHLLIMYAGSRRAPPHVARTRDEARALAEQLLQRAQRGAKFEELAAQYSDEPGAAGRGGDLGKFPKGAMVPEFEHAVEKIAVGSLSGVVETPFGFHVILRTQ
ncbi:thioredoxin domain-containing protein [Sorangium sp. So ce327]|uniref:thioredoxin domain-containing protein n=1 Tax=Sorangium sp. So ce327 TaxID=3133301 RepID=UPI003F5DAEA9